MNKIKSICIFCGTNSGVGLEYTKKTKQLASAMINRNINLVFGGGSSGLMRVVADEFALKKKEIIGVIPQRYITSGAEHPGMTQVVVASDMDDRMSQMIQLADAFIVLPGGLGTYSELFNVLYLIRMGIIKKPCAVYNIADFFDGILRFMEQSVNVEFLEVLHKEILISCDHPDFILDYMENYTPPVIPVLWK